MGFASVYFALFLLALAVLYYSPLFATLRSQNTLLLTVSLLFYWLGQPTSAAIAVRLIPLVVLVGTAVFGFFMGLQIERAAGKERLLRAAFALAVCLAVLAFFKYAGFVVPTLLSTTLLGKVGLPLGISFYTFALVSYLLDVHKGTMAAEKDFFAFCAWLFFFATIVSGPITRAKGFLPQLQQKRDFSEKGIGDGLRLMLIGYFRQVAVANMLGLYVNRIFAEYKTYAGFTLLTAAVLYAVQLYFEFAGYSDIARGSGAVLGLSVPENFRTPYFATNFSGFWSRWHITLSSWLQDYLFTPLVWSRWPSGLPVIGDRLQDPPILSSLLLVFAVSGLWHGNTMPFFVWGLLQAAFRIGEELLHRHVGKPKKNPAPLMRLGKSLAVFFLWMQSLVFFRLGLVPGATVGDGFSFLLRQWQTISLPRFGAETLAAIYQGFYAKPVMALFYIAFVALVLTAGYWMDHISFFRLKDAHISTALAAQNPIVRWALYFLLVGIILLAYILQSGGYGTVSFAYANF